MEVINDQYFDFLASTLGLIYIVLATKQIKWCWPAAFISSSIYVLLFVKTKLYFDAVLNAYYVMMAVVGWVFWTKDKTATLFPTWSKLKFTLISIAISGLLSFLLGYFANNFTDAQLPYADAFTTVFSFYATWLVTQKRIESWIFWIVIDIVAFTMYLNKELYFTAGLFFVYLIFSIYGLFEWKKQTKFE